ncbi:hypothetical protein ACFOWA_14605 [Pedobacter lithocola]|uniref:Type VI secretion system baseplate subunit TssF n=1 Tax=Pedobacter lithocola TaxID=1908239 RepID=A0ABV8PDQ3_9SPHI
MKPVFYSSKEEIKNRILKNAQDFWNIKHSSDFDPLVKLILEALSNELFNISNELKNLENRIFDKISRILAPDHLTASLPAHAIMHARTLEKFDEIGSQTQFFLKKNRTRSEENQKSMEIFFSPISKVALHSGQLKYMASGNSLYQITLNDKKTIFRTNPGSSFEPHTAYIGFEGFQSSEDLGGINLFFDWKNFSVPSNTYELILLCKFSLNDQPVSVHPDRFLNEHTVQNTHAPFHHKKLMHVIKADVQQFYSNRFLTLDDSQNLIGTTQEKFPKVFEQLFNIESQNRLEKGIIWMKIVFPASISPEMIQELFIYINAFPVVNKKLYQIKHRLKTMTNILPIKTEDEEQMLAVEKLGDNQGKVYTEVPYTNENHKEDGSFSIRIGGTERFDTRNAKEMIDYLFELLRDEKAAFSAYGPDFLDTTLKTLERTIALIEQKSKASMQSSKELPSYLVVKPIKDAAIMFLDLWITQAENANGISSGTGLSVHSDSRFLPESLILLSQTKGGRSRLNSSGRVQAYKYGLTTADKIVTKADIINFCKYELGDKISAISIEKGIAMGNRPNIGFIKTTEIVITPSTNLAFSAQDWDDLIEITVAKLAQRSTMNLTFKMRIKETIYR